MGGGGLVSLPAFRKNRLSGELSMYVDLVVSDHPAAIQFIAEKLGGKVVIYRHETEDVSANAGITDTYIVVRQELSQSYQQIPVLSSASKEDVRGKIVCGNLPLHLAQHCERVYAIEFEGNPPRGQEYSLEDMVVAGAKLVPYVVSGPNDPSSYKDRDVWLHSRYVVFLQEHYQKNKAKNPPPCAHGKNCPAC